MAIVFANSWIMLWWLATKRELGTGAGRLGGAAGMEGAVGTPFPITGYCPVQSSAWYPRCPYLGACPAEPTTPLAVGISGGACGPVSPVRAVANGIESFVQGIRPIRHLSFSTPVGAASGSNWCSWPASRPCWILISKRDSVRFLGRWLAIPGYSSCRWAPGSGPENILKRSGLHVYSLARFVRVRFLFVTSNCLQDGCYTYGPLPIINGYFTGYFNGIKHSINGIFMYLYLVFRAITVLNVYSGRFQNFVRTKRQNHTTSTSAISNEMKWH